MDERTKFYILKLAAVVFYKEAEARCEKRREERKEWRVSRKKFIFRQVFHSVLKRTGSTTINNVAFATKSLKRAGALVLRDGVKLSSFELPSPN